MIFEPVSEEYFLEWTQHPVTTRLMAMLTNDREEMKEGLINSIYADESEVKGRCRAIAILLNLEYQDLYQVKTKELEDASEE